MHLRQLAIACLLAMPALSPLNVHAQDASAITCESILANAAKGGMQTQMAIATIFHGKHMGAPCGEVDYDRAHALATQFGISFEPWANILRERAAGGNPRATAAVERLGL